MAKKKHATTKVSDTEPSQVNTSASVAGKGAWKALDASTAMIAALAAPRLAQIVWRAATGKSAPKNTRSAEITMTEAIIWAAIAGAFAQVLRTVASRTAANYWERSTGHAPPPTKKKK